MSAGRRRPVPAVRLRDLRSALAWTQAEAAAYVGRHPNTFARYEQGAIPIPLVILRLMEAVANDGR